MSTKLQKRQTCQIRISIENKTRLKTLSAGRNITMSKLLDEIVDNYFMSVSISVANQQTSTIVNK